MGVPWPIGSIRACWLIGVGVCAIETASQIDEWASMLALIFAVLIDRSGNLAGAAVFLASAASAYVTGTALSVVGGWLSR